MSERKKHIKEHDLTCDVSVSLQWQNKKKTQQLSFNNNKRSHVYTRRIERTKTTGTNINTTVIRMSKTRK